MVKNITTPIGEVIYYTLCPKKVVHQTHGDNFVNFLMDFPNSFTAGKRSKFPTKPT